jgi:hypothetical protein
VKKLFEEHFLKKYREIFLHHDLDRGDIKGDADMFYKQLIELTKINSVRRFYESDKAHFISLSYLLINDNEITYTMAAEMEPYELAILRLNPNIDKQTRLFAELNWG